MLFIFWFSFLYLCALYTVFGCKKYICLWQTLYEPVHLHVCFCSPVGLHHCRSVAALFGFLSEQSSHRTPHPLGGAAAAGANQLEWMWLTRGRCRSPRQQDPPTQPCGRTAAETQNASLKYTRRCFEANVNMLDLLDRQRGLEEQFVWASVCE